MKEKWLYTFEAKKPQKVKETTTEKDAAGADIQVTREVEKETALKYHILNPTRKLQDDANVFYSVKVSEGIKMGLITKSFLMRKFQQDGVLPSAEEKKTHADNYARAIKLEIDLEKIKQDPNLSDPEKELQASPLRAEYSELRQKIFDFETAQASLYDNTAEKRANDLLNLWFVLHLLYADNDGNPSCLFGDGTFDQRLERLNAVEESGDAFLTSVIEKGGFLIGRLNAGVSKEEIDSEVK